MHINIEIILLLVFGSSPFYYRKALFFIWSLLP